MIRWMLFEFWFIVIAYFHLYYNMKPTWYYQRAKYITLMIMSIINFANLSNRALDFYDNYLEWYKGRKHEECSLLWIVVMDQKKSLLILWQEGIDWWCVGCWNCSRAGPCKQQHCVRLLRSETAVLPEWSFVMPLIPRKRSSISTDSADSADEKEWRK